MITSVRSHALCILGAALFACPLAWAQADERDKTAEDPEQKQDTIFEFRITPQMLSNGLDLLVAKRLTKDYGLDEYQQEQMRRVLHEHVPKFLKEHRQELQELWIEWTEAISSGQPPDADYAAAWADRLLPLVEEARGTADRVADDMRTFLDDEQEVLLDGYLAVIDIGTKSVTNRLHVFKEGGFDPEIHWPGSKEFRRLDRVEAKQLRQKMEVARVAAMGGTAPTPRRHPVDKRTPSQPDRAAPPAKADGATSDRQLVADAQRGKPRPAAKPKTTKDEWTRYVEAFIARYQLDAEQRQKAYALLTQQKEQRDRYLLGKGSEMERVEKMFANAKGDPEKTALAESAYQRLMAPVDRLFTQLKQKLDRLPTRAQRRAASKADRRAAQPPNAPPKTSGKDQ